jgi:hypothetical protein
VRKDILKNIDVHKENEALMRSLRQNQFSELKNKWAVGCTKYTATKVDKEGTLLP